MNNRLSKEVLLVRTMVLFWIIAKVISWNLWDNTRDFPLLNLVPIPFDYEHSFFLLLPYFSLAFLFLAFIFPTSKLVYFLVLFTEIFTCLIDYNRWQPWEYQYVLMLIVLLFTSKINSLKAIKLTLIGIYFWSGISKCNGGFLHFIWQSLILKKGLGLSNEFVYQDFVHYFGLLIPFLEIALAIGLLFLSKKRWIIFLLSGMHLVILLLFGPFMLSINPVIWPWNLAMIVFLFILFYKEDYSEILLFFTIKKPSFYIPLLFVCILPFCSYFSLWDRYLSFRLYSGNESKFVAVLSGNTDKLTCKNLLNSKFKPFYKDTVLVFNQWSYKDLNVPLNSSTRAYKVLAHTIENKYPHIHFKFYIGNYPYTKKDYKKFK